METSAKSRSEVVQSKREEMRKLERQNRHQMAMDIEMNENQESTFASNFKPRRQIIGNKKFDMLDLINKMQSRDYDDPNKISANCANEKLRQVQAELEFQKAENYRLQLQNESLKRTKNAPPPLANRMRKATIYGLTREGLTEHLGKWNFDLTLHPLSDENARRVLFMLEHYDKDKALEIIRESFSE